MWGPGSGGAPPVVIHLSSVWPRPVLPRARRSPLTSVVLPVLVRLKQDIVGPLEQDISLLSLTHLVFPFS